MTTIQVRVDDKTKKDAQFVLEQIGLDLPTAFRLYLKKIIQTKGIPFNLNLDITENGLTSKQEDEILRRSREDDLVGHFDSAEEFIAHLHNETKK